MKMMSTKTRNAPNKRRVTLQQIADVTGLSRTTVCDILHRDIEGKYSYSQDTRQRVLDAVRQLGYVPSLAARQLRRGRSGRVGLMLTIEFSGRFFAQVAAAVEREVRSRKLRLQVTVTEGDPQTEYEQMIRLQEDEIEGVIVGPVYDTAELEQHRSFFQGRLPTVLFGGPCGSEFDEVALDHVAARRLAAEHLLARGHRRIGFLCAPRSLVTRRVSPALHEELRRVGLKKPWIIEYSEARCHEDFYRGAIEFAQRWKGASPSDRPTGMVCLNDEVAMTAIAALRSEGIGVPDDLSLVGCDNIPEARYLLPPLTTVDNHAEEQMSAAVARLVERIEHPQAKRTVQVITPTLVVRESAASVIK